MCVTNLLDKRNNFVTNVFCRVDHSGSTFPMHPSTLFGYVWIHLFHFTSGYDLWLTLPSQDLFGCAIVIECLLKNLVSYLICSLQKNYKSLKDI